MRSKGQGHDKTKYGQKSTDQKCTFLVKAYLLRFTVKDIELITTTEDWQNYNVKRQ